MINQDPSTYVILSCESLNNEEIQNTSLKQVIFQALNQSINLKKNPDKALWNGLNSDTRMQVQNCAFSNLVNPNE